ncbi:hypothetical protein M2480_001784 [Parabacteroides sp. PFB2-12]|uniref:hypothetical protein n=1 Tax=unclassified Parabacteroides TaxID=2649774 RepID=UPI0024758564|nr:MULTISPECIES: hypothetical protein [unclassified Parabacteroides]MDH6343158.1 hypothetical protein [Parabacteroides sp. PM6-13]MDH6390802.1 hypothetical protein [Parabacteroides sp. PFB2-12]
MAGLYFRIGADFQALAKLKAKLEELKKQLATIDTGAEPQLAKKLTKELNEVQKKIETTAERVSKETNAIQSDFQRLGTTISSTFDGLKSANDFKEAITAQRQAIRGLEAELTKLNDSLPEARKRRNANEQTQKSYQDLVKQVANYKDEVRGEKQALKELEKGYKDLLKEQQKLAKEQGKPGKTDTSVFTQLRMVREEMIKLELAGKGETARYRELQAELERTGTAYRKIQQEQKALTTSGTQLAGIFSGMTGVMGAFTAAQGGMSLFVDDNEKLIKVQTRLQALMSMTIGLQQISNTMHQTSAFRISTVTKITQLWSAAQNRLTIALGGSTVAAQVLMATLTLGLSAAITGIVVLIDRYRSKQKQASEEAKKFADSVSSSAQQTMADYEALRASYEKLGNEIQSKQKFITENQDAFKKLGIEINNVNDADNAFITNAQAFRDSVVLRANAVAAMEVASEKYKEAMKKGMEADNTEKNIGWLDRTFGQSGMFQRDGEKVKLPKHIAKKGDELRQAGEEIRQEGDKYIAKYLEFTDKANEALKNAGIKSAGKPTTSSNSNRIDALNDKEGLQRMKMEKDLQNRISQAKVDAMADGWEKEKAQLALNHKKELSDLETQQEEYLQKLREYERKRFEADPANKGKTFDASSVQLNALDNLYFGTLNKEILNKQEKETADFAKNLKRQQQDITNEFASELDKRLLDIDRYYEDAIQKAEGHQEMIAQLEAAWTEKRKRAALESQLESNSFNQEIATGEVDIKFDNTGMIESAEREKTEILKRYAQERIAILSQVGDQQSQQEVKALQQTVKGYDAALKKPKGIKQLFDEKVFKSVQKHFEKTSKDAEEAEGKTTAFFQATSNAGAIASDVAGAMQGAFGGVSDELDMALDAVGNIAKGFAEGGLIGGISAAAGQLISITTDLITAKKEVSQETLDNYKAYIDVLDQLIDKQIESLESLGGSEFTKAISKTYTDLKKQITAAQKLFKETMASGSGLFSHSVGYGANKTLKEYSRELKRIGIYQTDLSKMNAKQLMSLQEIPELWAKLPEELRQYIEQIINSTEEIENMQQTLQDMLLGFSADDITQTIVDSLTDPSIDNAMEDLSDKMDEYIAGIVKNIITKMALVQPITDAVNQLMKGIATYDKDGNISGFKNVKDIETSVLSTFKDTVMGIASGFGDVWKDLASTFGQAGINLNGKVGEESSSSDNSMKGALAKASQQSIDLLAGQMGAGRVALERGANAAESIRDLLSGKGFEIDMTAIDSLKESFQLSQDIMTNSFGELTAIRELNAKIEANTAQLNSISDRMAGGIDTIAANTEQLSQLEGIAESGKAIAGNTDSVANSLKGTLDVKMKGGGGLGL